MNWLTYSWWIRASQSVLIERNFNTVNARPNCPKRSCLNSTGPLEVNLIATAMAAKTGENVSKAMALPATSITRFKARANLRDSSFLERSGYRVMFAEWSVSSDSHSSGKKWNDTVI